ncbi:MAG TPA: PKD domain-containing protein [Solirubrobacteraceae bacterium]
MRAALALAAVALAIAAAPASAATKSVLIGATFFDPQTVTINAGDTVTWTSGAGRHTVSSTTGAFDSGPLAEGQSFSHTFATAGSYAYRDRLNPQIAEATVIVQAVGNAVPSAKFQVTPLSAEAGTAVQFDATASADADGSITHYRWDFDGDGAYETDTGASARYAKAFANTTDAPRTIKVGLLVTDNKGSSALAEPVTITILPATAGGADTTPPDVTLVGSRRGRLTLRLGEWARVRIRIERFRPRRRPALVKRFTRVRPAGRVTITYATRTLRPGRYRITAIAEDEAGNRAPAVSARFEVRRK